MSGLLLAIALMQALPQNQGAVMGIVRSAEGTPAAGIRVFAIPAGSTIEQAGNGTVFESQAQTGDDGRYRLDVAAGRYYIASGSVSSPTYAPGTTDVAAARVVTVDANGILENVDIDGFVPPVRTQSRLFTAGIIFPPAGTGVLSGTVRYSDGSPGAGLRVTLIAASPVSPANPPSSLQAGTPAAYLSYLVGYSLPQQVATVDDAGRYQVTAVPPGTYYLVSGFAEAPVFYPGTTSSPPQSIVTTETTRLDNLDFVVTRPPPGTTVSGKVSDVVGAPAGNAIVKLSPEGSTSRSPAAYGLPARTHPVEHLVADDGTFEFTGVIPGTYTLDALIPGTIQKTEQVVVRDQPVAGVDFKFPLATTSGRILLEDGSVPPDSPLFESVVLRTATNPNLLQSTILTISKNGTFSRIMEAGVYQVFLSVLPEKYVVRSITSKGADLMAGTLSLTGIGPAEIEIRVAPRSSAPAGAAGVVSGKLLDAVTGIPSAGETVTLCCLEDRTYRALAATVQTEGAFEFHGVPPGQYTVGLSDPSVALLGERALEVGNEGRTGLELKSTAVMVGVTVLFATEGSGAAPPRSVRLEIREASGPLVFEGTTTGFERSLFASIPASLTYRIRVLAPPGFAVKSINNTTGAEATIQVGTDPPKAILVTITPLP